MASIDRITRPASVRALVDVNVDFTYFSVSHQTTLLMLMAGTIAQCLKTLAVKRQTRRQARYHVTRKCYQVIVKGRDVLQSGEYSGASPHLQKLAASSGNAVWFG